MGQSTFQFTKIVEKMSKTESKINSALKSIGQDMIVPVIANFDVGTGNKKIRKQSMVGQLAQRVKKKASFLSTSMRNTHVDNIESISNCKSLFITYFYYLCFIASIYFISF